MPVILNSTNVCTYDEHNFGFEFKIFVVILIPQIFLRLEHFFFRIFEMIFSVNSPSKPDMSPILDFSSGIGIR